MSRQSPIVEQLTRLVALGAGDDLGLTELELAALAYDWDLWCRPNQQIPPTVELSDPPPEGARWPLWGRTRPGEPWRIGAFIGTRGTGKTTPIVRYVHRMAMSLQWPRMLLVAQGEKEMIKLFVDAPNGPVKSAPPWERPYYTAATGGKGARLIWPSGAEAVLTCCGAKFERGPEYNGAWCTELVDWPHNRRIETWAHVQAVVRQEPGQILVDSTPKAGHPILEEIKAKAETKKSWWWMRHHKRDNELFLLPGWIDELSEALAGTALHAEEVEGVEAEQRGLVKMADIEAARRALASQFKRRIVVLDPTGADPKRSEKLDIVGLMGWGLCMDEQLMPTEDRSGHMHPEDCAVSAVVMYIRDKCDCLVIETDRGGVLPASLVAAAARDYAPTPQEDPERTAKLRELRRVLAGTEWRVIKVDPAFRTRYQHGTIYVREVRTWADKQTRASLLAQKYHQHRISHPYEVDLDSYETTITTHQFKSNEQSPGDLDCGTWAVVELGGLYQTLKMGQAEGLAQLAAAARAAGQQRPRQDVSRLWPQAGDGRATGSRI